MKLEVPGPRLESSGETLTRGLTVVLPCLNEEETLETCIRKAQASLVALGLFGEVVVADNGSSDRSREIAVASGARLVDVPERGYGAALRAGINACRTDLAIMADADDSYALDDLKPFAESLLAGADFVIGNRFAGGIAPGAMPFLHRYLGNPVLSLIGRWLFKTHIRDFHCGIRGFSVQKIRELNLATNGMEFATEMVAKASVSGLKIAEVPTTLRPDGRSRAPHLRTWPDGWRHLTFMLALSPRALFSTFAAALGTAAFLLLVVLARGSIELGGLSFGTGTFVLAAVGLSLAFQLQLIGRLAELHLSGLGLIPAKGNRLWRLFEHGRGVLVAIALIVAAVVMAAFAVSRWRSNDFQVLSQDYSARVFAISGAMAVSGISLLLTSVFSYVSRAVQVTR